SQVQNFDILGHSYFQGPHLASGSFGAGINTPRVYKGIAYLAGYPPTMFGVVIADVRDPANMKMLSFIPNNAGTRTAYLRLNTQKMILVIGRDATPATTRKPPTGRITSSTAKSGTRTATVSRSPGAPRGSSCSTQATRRT